VNSSAKPEEKMKVACRTINGLSLATATLFGIGSACAQSAADVAAVTAANNAFYTAESALDIPSMEKVWAHEEYVAFAVPRSKEPTFGWTALQLLLTKGFSNLSQISLMPVDTHVHVYGNSAWAIGKEEIGSASKLKDGTPLSSRPTIVTNIFEKHGDNWLMVAHHAQEIPQ
jgi:ketosteroid isomerase-like protein